MQSTVEAPSATAAVPLLSGLTTREEYQAERRTAFPSTTSLDWHIRRHKSVLLERGALVFLSGRLLVNPPRFDEVSLELGRQEAVRRGGGLS